MNKNIKNNEVRGLFMNMAIVAIVLICSLIIFFIKGFSWLTDNKSINSSGGSIKVAGAAMGTIDLYEYDEATKTLIAKSDILLNSYPALSKTFVLLMMNEATSEVAFSYAFDDFSVNYYALQQYKQEAALKAFLEQYINAGPYVKTLNNEVIDFTGITAEQYLSFVHPCSNAIKVKVSEVIINSAVINPVEYVAGQIGSGSIIYGAAQTLLQTSHGVTSIAANSSENKPYILDANVIETDFFPLTETPAQFKPATLGVGESRAVVITFYFDETVFSQSIIGADTVTLQNSNPFMFQRLKIGKIKCETTLG